MKDKYYTRSNGEKIKISEMNSEHILNALGKKQREIFSSQTRDEFSKGLEEVNNLKEEYHKRLNEYYDKLGD